MATKLLFFAGSARINSINKRLAKAAYNMALEQGATATFIDLKNYPMPLYDGDLEDASGLPEKAIELKKIFTSHNGFFIASPEYNGFFSPLLKNSLDWISRSHEENEPSLSAYRNKITAIVAASPGGVGGLRGLVSLRMMLGNISTIVLPEQLAISHAVEAFDNEGNLINEHYKKTLSTIVRRLILVAEQTHE